jgi:hypothetical protein
VFLTKQEPKERFLVFGSGCQDAVGEKGLYCGNVECGGEAELASPVQSVNLDWYEWQAELMVCKRILKGIKE